MLTPKKNSVAGIPQEGTLQFCSRKCKVMTKRTRSSKSCKMSKREKETNTVVNFDSGGHGGSMVRNCCRSHAA